MAKGTEVKMTERKECDLCKHERREKPKQAEYDARIYGSTSWAWMCQEHFDIYGMGLGTGLGQKLVYQD